MSNPEYIEAEAAEIINANKKLNPQKKADIMNTVVSQANAYNSIAAGDTAALMDLIRQNSKIRRTGTFVKNELGAGVEWALQRNANDEQFLRDVAVTQIRSIASITTRSTSWKLLKTPHNSHAVKSGDCYP